MVKRICRILNIPRSTYYKALLCVPSNREKEASDLKSQIYEIWKENKKRYDAPKIQKSMLILRQQNKHCLNISNLGIIGREFIVQSSGERVKLFVSMVLT